MTTKAVTTLCDPHAYVITTSSFIFLISSFLTCKSVKWQRIPEAALWLLQNSDKLRQLLICSTYPKRLLYPCLKCAVNTTTNYLMSALCPNLPELKNKNNISPTVFLTGETILLRYIRLLKITSFGNFYLKYCTG